MPISKETAVVYRSFNRRFLTKEGAICHYAKIKTRERYKCQCDPECGSCGYHNHLDENILSLSIVEEYNEWATEYAIHYKAAKSQISQLVRKETP